MTKDRMHSVLLNYAKGQLQDKDCPLNEVEWVTLLNCYAGKKSSDICAQKLNRPDINVNVWYTRMSMALAMDALAMEI